MATEWTMIRVSKATQRRMADVLARYLSNDNATAIQTRATRSDKITYDALINLLLDREQRKAERGQESRRRCATKGKAKGMYTCNATSDVSSVEATCY